MVALIAALHQIADFRRLYEELAKIDCLDYVFDLCRLLGTGSKSNDFIDLVVEAFKVSV